MDEQEMLMEEKPAEALEETVARIVDAALARALSAWESGNAERERIAAMSDEEREAYAADRREAALAEREQRLLERELRAMAVEELAARGLPAELADALPYNDEARCRAELDALERVFRRAVRESVDERLRGRTPEDAAAGSQRACADRERAFQMACGSRK